MNRLQHEQSPYLLQHAHNPVDWFAWKPEAFEKAQKENKPILVSIGYSTCHWCHVMERESFENPDIADFMNTHFVCIKVDREERPDVDAIYMEACQILSGSGGWPLNCFLTPDRKPYYAGTYFPPRPMHNRPSWLQVLRHMTDAWETQRPQVLEQAEKLMGYMQRNDDALLQDESAPLREGALFIPGQDNGASFQLIFEKISDRFDHRHGGFGAAPKFPSTMVIQYLMSYYWFSNNDEALEQALFSLDKMIAGGLYDQLGGGFSRYATDAAWLVPHFEKMLYDNALLVLNLADAIRLIQSDSVLENRFAARLQNYRATLVETIEWVLREMTHENGGFYAALDADSEGEEGKFYVWDKAEIVQQLGTDAALFCDFYDVSETGNWEHHNILNRPQSYETFAAERSLDPEFVKTQLAQMRNTLLEHRSKRVRPGLDDKMLLDWNALMNTAFTAAYAATGNASYLQVAEKNMAFLLDAFVQQPDTEGAVPLLHSWAKGKAQYPAMLDDYAFLIAALLELYQIRFDQNLLSWAEKYTQYVLSYFLDANSGLFFNTSNEQGDIILRKKEMYDNATPSGNSTMVLNLQRLSVLLDKPAWRSISSRMLARAGKGTQQYPLSLGRWALGMLTEGKGMVEIAIVGDNAFEKALALQKMFVPNKVLVCSQQASEVLPLLAGKPGATEALIYLCRDFACQKPVDSLEKLVSQLK